MNSENPIAAGYDGGRHGYGAPKPAILDGPHFPPIPEPAKIDDSCAGVCVGSAPAPILVRIGHSLFPRRHVELPPAPSHWKDVLWMNTKTELSFLDRVRVMISGRIEMKSKTVTENEIGQSMTSAEMAVLPPRFLDR